MQRAASALNCLSAIAASILVASVIPAAAEPGAIEASEHEIEAPAAGMTLAALEPSPGSKDADNERTIERLVTNPAGRIYLSAEDAIVGIASFYDDPQETASGEQYNPNAYTAAAQLEIRHKFGGVQYGRLYQEAYGLGEYRGKKIIVRFNDVGPLRPGRKFDLSRAAMAYFDSTLEKGLLPNFKMTPLPLGRSYPKGPITDEQLAALGIDDDAAVNVCDVVLDDAKPIYTASTAPKPPVVQAARAEQPKPQAAQPVVAKPVVIATPAVVTKPAVIAKPAPARVAAKAVPARPATKTAAARAPVKTATSAPKTTDEAPAVTPWIKRVVTWIASKTSAQ